MKDTFAITVGQDVLAHLPDMRVTALLFGEARFGMPAARIDTMRERVLTQLHERMATVRDPRNLPGSAAFRKGLPELAAGRRSLAIDDLIRGVMRREPFPVLNDAVDAARILSLHYGVPISALDPAKMRQPLALRLADYGTVAKVPSGAAVDLSGLPVLFDPSGPVDSPIIELARAQATRLARAIVLVVYDAARQDAVDPADVEARASNWLGTLVHAKIQRVVVTP
jgi:DNA/RNA-binding domain of Phe-tRNA-synthetase-like protein